MSFSLFRSIHDLHQLKKAYPLRRSRPALSMNYTMYYICEVRLENFDLSHVPVYIMDEEMLSLYAVYMATLGNREDLFPGSGYVDKYTKPPTTYDIPPSALEDETFGSHFWRYCSYGLCK